MLNIKTVTYNWLENPDSPTQIGFLAQDLEQYFQNLLQQTLRVKSVFYAQMAPILVEAIREMNLKLPLSMTWPPNTWRDAIIAWFGNVENGDYRILVKSFYRRIVCKRFCGSDMYYTRSIGCIIEWSRNSNSTAINQIL